MMTRMIILLTLVSQLSWSRSAAQSDTLPLPAIDTSLYSEIDLFQDLDAFLDSLMKPRSYFLASLNMGKAVFNFVSKESILLSAEEKFTYSPTLGYYHKSGLGFTGIGYMINNDDKMNLYQVSLSPSYDYLEHDDFASGFAYTRFFTKDSLDFYTSPLQNELYGYFTYRRWPVKPTVALSYGWGSRSEYEEREELIESLQLRRRGYIRITNTESVSDFSIMTSLRRDFYWLDVFTYNDHIRFTPQLTFTSGTQKFGFNQTANTYATNLRTGANVLYNSENVYLDDNIKFQPLSLTGFLRAEYSIGKFFVQPQLALDYYFPASEKKFNTAVSVVAGFMF